jgi:hypothetical protein
LKSWQTSQALASTRSGRGTWCLCTTQVRKNDAGVEAYHATYVTFTRHLCCSKWATLLRAAEPHFATCLCSTTALCPGDDLTQKQHGIFTVHCLLTAHVGHALLLTSQVP